MAMNARRFASRSLLTGRLLAIDASMPRTLCRAAVSVTCAAVLERKRLKAVALVLVLVQQRLLENHQLATHLLHRLVVVPSSMRTSLRGLQVRCVHHVFHAGRGIT